jgi:ABC-type polysaccharide/polyol phosphate transport system ATPase subunit
MSTGDRYALEVEGLGKAYRMYPGALPRILEGLSLGRWRGHHEFWALRGVDLRMRPGSSLGLGGANGAGKSTLLKILAGTTAPTEGRYRLGGRVASLLELGAGFHGDFTGRANIVMNGVMMGFTRRDMEAKIGEIIDFAELGDFIDEPVRTYSSGMGLRLGFAIAVAVNPEVLIVDEVFAVGDMYFQKKCVDKIYAFKRANKTILFCSHSLYDVRQMCDEAMWLDRGKPMAQGDSVSVTNEYSAFQRHHIGEVDLTHDQFPTSPRVAGRSPDSLPRILDARIYRLGTDEECYRYSTGDSFEIRVWWENPRPQETPIHLGIGFLRQDLTTCGGAGTQLSGFALEGARGCTVLRVPGVRLLSGQFLVPVILLDEAGVHRYQEFLMSENLVVRTNTREVGLFRLETSWEARDLPPPARVERQRTGGAR